MDEKLEIPEKLVLYAVRNSDGQWFRRKGYGGYGKTWCGEFHKARIYTAPKGARGVVTWFARQYPDYPPPHLVALHIGAVEVIDESDRLKKVFVDHVTQKARRDARHKQMLLHQAQLDLDEAQRRIEELNVDENDGCCEH